MLEIGAEGVFPSTDAVWHLQDGDHARRGPGSRTADGRREKFRDVICVSKISVVGVRCVASLKAGWSIKALSVGTLGCWSGRRWCDPGWRRRRAHFRFAWAAGVRTGKRESQDCTGVGPEAGIDDAASGYAAREAPRGPEENSSVMGKSSTSRCSRPMTVLYRVQRSS